MLGIFGGIPNETVGLVEQEIVTSSFSAFTLLRIRGFNKDLMTPRYPLGAGGEHLWRTEVQEASALFVT